MKRFFSVASCVLVASLSAMAQEYPRAEVFGGYSFFHADGSSFFRLGGGENLNGWNASVCGNLNSWFGLAADFSGHYDSSSSTTNVSLPGFPPLPPLPTFSSTFKSDTNIFTFLVGPRFSYRKNERITPFAHILFGASRRHTDSEISSSSFGRSSFAANDTAFAAAVGGGLDVPLSKNLALRVVQPSMC
jgi:opacity protein-like surface antigen